jgi:hypothetical protein
MAREADGVKGFEDRCSATSCSPGSLVTVLFAVLPAASYAAHAVGLAGVLAPLGALITGRLLVSRSVTTHAEKSELSKTALHVVLALVVACLIVFTMIEVGALAIEMQFINPIGATESRRYWLAIVIESSVLLVLSVFVNLNRPRRISWSAQR